MPLITVMMPARNAQGTLDAAIASTLRAMPRDSELVVWNDGSDDSTAEKVERWRTRDARTQLKSVSESVGGGASRSQIMADTDSEFIASMDADDITLPWRFRVQLNAIGRGDIVFSPTVRFQSLARWTPQVPYRLTPREARIALLIHNPFSHPTLFARRSALVDVGGYSPLRAAQDYELWLRAASHGKSIVRTAVPTVLYRLSSTQVSASADYRDKLKNPQLLASYRELLERECPEATVDDVMQSTRFLTGLVNGLPHPLRPYYRRIIDREGSAMLSMYQATLHER